MPTKTPAAEAVSHTSSDVHAFRVYMPFKEQLALHSHGQHEFYYCDRGPGQQLTSGGTWSSSSGDLWLFPAGVLHMGNGHPRQRHDGIVLSVHERATFGGPHDDSAGIFARLLAVHDAEHPRVELAPSSRGPLKRLMHSLVHEREQAAPGFRAMLRARLMELIALLARDPHLGPRLRSAANPVSQAERIAPVLRYCAVHYREPIGVDELCAQAGLGRSQLHALFKAETGHSPGEHLARLRVAEAQRLLHQPGASVLDVSLEVGYGSLSHFYSQFQRIVGLPPARWVRAGEGGGTN
jgi:AraC-like DNA-binding protein/quercetin dioxygenase-like cupin family protein